MLIDTTLRDGEQAPGVFLRAQDRMQIAHGLAALGIRELEIRSPVLDPQALKDTRELLQIGPPVEWLFWCRAKQEDLDAAEEAGATRVHIAFPTSDVQLGTLGMDWSMVLTYLKPLLQHALKTFPFVSAGAQDAGRTPAERLVAYAHALHDIGIKRLRIADTVGLMSPSQVQQLVRRIRSACPDFDLEFHGHNDLGLATANALAALEAGATHVSATVLGIGERSGNASLEQIAMAMRVWNPNSASLHTEHIAMLCELVSRAMGFPIPAWHPIVGLNATRHQSGIHVSAMHKDPASFQPFSPELAGRSGSEIVFGPMGGRESLRHVLRNHGIIPNESLLLTMLQHVRNQMRMLGRCVSSSELVGLYQAMSKA